jgi:hypothetical protein
MHINCCRRCCLLVHALQQQLREVESEEGRFAVSCNTDLAYQLLPLLSPFMALLAVLCSAAAAA